MATEIEDMVANAVFAHPFEGLSNEEQQKVTAITVKLKSI